MLGKKQSIRNSDWLKAISSIETSVSRSRIQALTAQAVADIRRTCAGKRAAYAWSGGKDSIALGHICELAGIKDCVLVVCDLEYPAFNDWVKSHSPEKLEIVNTGQNLEWLSKNLQMLFPAQVRQPQSGFISSNIADKLFIIKSTSSTSSVLEDVRQMVIMWDVEVTSTQTLKVLRATAPSQSGRMKMSSLTFTTTTYLSHPYTNGRTVICAAHTNGLQDSGQEALKMDGERFTTSTVR